MLLQRRWLADIAESVPSLVFLALWRNGFDAELAGWIGVALAAITLVAFRYFRTPYNPILLGINVHLIVITPLIIFATELGALELAHLLFVSSERGVLVTVLLVGCVLTAFSSRGFIGADDLLAASRRTCSLILLAASAAAIVWSFLYAEGMLMAVAVPMMALFGLRRLLIARGLTRSGRSGGAVAIAAIPLLAADHETATG